MNTSDKYLLCRDGDGTLSLWEKNSHPLATILHNTWIGPLAKDNWDEGLLLDGQEGKGTQLFLENLAPPEGVERGKAVVISMDIAVKPISKPLWGEGDIIEWWGKHAC